MTDFAFSAPVEQQTSWAVTNGIAHDVCDAFGMPQVDYWKLTHARDVSRSIRGTATARLSDLGYGTEIKAKRFGYEAKLIVYDSGVIGLARQGFPDRGRLWTCIFPDGKLVHALQAWDELSQKLADRLTPLRPLAAHKIYDEVQTVSRHVYGLAPGIPEAAPG